MLKRIKNEIEDSLFGAHKRPHAAALAPKPQPFSRFLFLKEEFTHLNKNVKESLSHKGIES